MVTGENLEQILAVPKLKSSCAKDQVDEIFEAVQDWNLETHIKALSLDKKYVNTFN